MPWRYILNPIPMADTITTNPAPTLFTQNQWRQLIDNGRRSRTTPSTAMRPVVKLFTPDAQATWLLTDADDDGLCFGLCDLGCGEPELGYVAITELLTVRGGLGLPIERDRYFKADKSLGEYLAMAREHGRVVS